MSQRKRILDLAFAMDTTGSMGSYIQQAQQCIRNIVDEIVLTANAEVHLAYVEYRDHPPQDNTFVTRVHDFTPSVKEMKRWLDDSSAHGGGDTPEAVADALHAVRNLSWCGQATKLCILICDAPPHGLEKSGDTFPGGCPDGHDCMEITNDLAQKGVILYVVGCSISNNTWKEFYRALAHISGGQYVPLAEATCLAQVIIGGAQEELSLEELMADIQAEVMKQIKLLGEDTDEDTIVDLIYKHFSERGTRVKQLNLNSAPLPKASKGAVEIALLSNMYAVRKMISQGLGLSSDTSFLSDHVREYKIVENEVTKEQIARMVRKATRVRPPPLKLADKDTQTEIIPVNASTQTEWQENWFWDEERFGWTPPVSQERFWEIMFTQSIWSALAVLIGLYIFTML